MLKFKILALVLTLFSAFLIYAQFLPPDQSSHPSGATEKELGVSCNSRQPQGYEHARGWPVNYHYNRYGGPPSVDCSTILSEDYPLALILDIGLIAIVITADAMLIKYISLNRPVKTIRS
jgi:hypothetical protein